MVGLSFREKILIMYDVASTAVAATSFFTGDKEIFDFVFERVKRCIAAKKAPKIFHLSVSHRKFLANYGVY